MKIKLVFKEYLAHILLLLTGAVILLAGCFQNSLWFDEAYTVGMMSYDGFEGLKWAIFDVHPHLYYFLLRIFTLVFGNSLPVMRVFSAIGALLFAALGFTHIRKDFGKSVGFWFSFCAIFSASTLHYALEIRMYTWAAYFVALAAIYAFRMYNHPEKNSFRILFLIFSLCSAYTHHFGLFAVSGINLALLYRTIKEKRPMKEWWQNAAVQIGCYLPCAFMFLLQVINGVAGWITVKFPDVILDFVSYHLLGDTLRNFVDGDKTRYMLFGIIFYALYIIAGICLWKYSKSASMPSEQKRALGGAVKVYFGVFVFSLNVSLFKAMYHIRYTVVICGFLFFMIAILISNLNRKALKAIAALILVSFFAIQASGIYKNRYDPSANYVRQYMDEYICEEDAILFEGIDGFVISVQYPENDTYFYNSGNWQVHKTYRALGENTHIVDELPKVDFGDRVWTLGRGDCYKYLVSQGYAETESKKVSAAYHNYNFNIILLERK